MIGLGNILPLIKNQNNKSLYQQWENYPDSPLLTADYPYQIITYGGGSTYELSMCTEALMRSGGEVYNKINKTLKIYKIVDGQWQFNRNSNYVSFSPPILEANADVYADTSYTTVYFAKTTG